jgi:hypothetical protein
MHCHFFEANLDRRMRFNCKLSQSSHQAKRFLGKKKQFLPFFLSWSRTNHKPAASTLEHAAITATTRTTFMMPTLSKIAQSVLKSSDSFIFMLEKKAKTGGRNVTLKL